MNHIISHLIWSICSTAISKVIYVDYCIRKTIKHLFCMRKLHFFSCNKKMNLSKVCFFSSIFSIVHGNFVGSLMKIKNEVDQVWSQLDKRHYSKILFEILISVSSGISGKSNNERDQPSKGCRIWKLHFWWFSMRNENDLS